MALIKVTPPDPLLTQEGENKKGPSYIMMRDDPHLVVSPFILRECPSLDVPPLKVRGG